MSRASDTTLPQQSQVVGRRYELSVLELGLADAAAGRGRLFLVTGEPGIGKTRLARELAERAGRGGARVLWGRSWETGGAPEYWPWMQILRPLVADEPELPPAWAERLARMLPELRTGESAPGTEPPDVESERFRLFETTAALLARHAARRPLVVVADDLHAADLSSILLLAFATRELRATRALLLATFRDVEAARDPRRARLLADLRRDAETLALGALAPEEIAELLAHELGAPQPEAQVREVYRLSEGNPLFAHEAIRVLRGGGTLPHAGRLHDLVRDRLDLLSPDCAELLAVAAVIGREFDTLDLCHATDFVPERVLELLGEGEAFGLIRASGRETAPYGFAHGILRDALYAALPPARRAAIHRRVAEALARRYGADPNARLGELARHFAEAAPAGDDPRVAVDYARRAGDRARAGLAFGEAVEHYQNALRLLEPATDPALHRELVLALATAQSQSGDGRAARASFLQAAELARTAGDVAQLARAAIGIAGRGDLHTRLDREAIAHLEEALERLDDADAVLRARLLTRLTKALYYSGPRARVTAAADEALMLARQVGDPALLAAALDAKHFALWGPGPTAEKLAVANEILEHGRAAHSREAEIAGHFWRFADLLEAGDLLGATTALGLYEEIAAELRQPFFLWRTATHRAALAILQGRFADAERLVQKAVEIGEQLASRNPALIAGIQLYVLQREQAPTAEIEASLRAMADENPAMPAFRAALAHVLSELGRTEDARAEFEAVAAAGFASMPRDANWLSMMGELATAAAFLGDAPRAAELYDLLLPFGEQVIVTGLADLCEGAVARHLGVLAAALGRWDAALAHFERALEIDGRLGARPYLARTKYALAHALATRDAPGDRARAQALLEEARGLAAAVGMRLLEERAAALAATLEAQAPPAGNVFRFNGNVWTICYAGATVHVKNRKGIHYLAHLLARPGIECHALELEAALAGGGPAALGTRERLDEGLAVRTLDGFDPVLDERAKREYRRRLAELRGELDDAQACRDLGRAERARTEIEALERALTSAYGLGGRASAAGSAAERARVSVTKAVRQAIEDLAGAHPELGVHLRETVRTGRFLQYAATVAWTVGIESRPTRR